MRVAKLSTDVFEEETEFNQFFDIDLWDRDPPGLFHIGPQIAADGLAPGETILFTYRGRLRFVGRTATGRLNNTYSLETEYPYCFIVARGSVRPADVSLAEVQQALAAAGVEISLEGQGWNRLPDNPEAEQAILELVSH